MPGEEMKIIMEMRQDIGEIKGILSTLVNTNNIAIEASNTARSAHHRIGELQEDIKNLTQALEKIKDNQNWLPKTITACVITTIVGGLVGAGISQSIGGP